MADNQAIQLEPAQELRPPVGITGGPVIGDLVGDSDRIGTVRVHHVDLKISVSVALKSNLGPVR